MAEPDVKPRDERTPGGGAPMLSYVESAELHAQIAGQILAAKLTQPKPPLPFSADASDEIFYATEMARQLLMSMGLFRLNPHATYENSQND